MTVPLSEEQLAYHEAGHAVARVVLGGHVDRVSLRMDDPPKSVNPDGPVAELAVRDRIAVLLAGDAALALKDNTSIASESDRQRAEALAGADAASVLAAEQERVTQLLRDRWSSVESIAQLLIQKRVIDHADVAAAT
jgi:ATP-dependent Zn protease